MCVINDVRALDVLKYVVSRQTCEVYKRISTQALADFDGTEFVSGYDTDLKRDGLDAQISDDPFYDDIASVVSSKLSMRKTLDDHVPGTPTSRSFCKARIPPVSPRGPLQKSPLVVHMPRARLTP